MSPELILMAVVLTFALAAGGYLAWDDYKLTKLMRQWEADTLRRLLDDRKEGRE